MCPDDQTLSRYFDGEIDPQTAANVEQHISTCTGCMEKLNKFTGLREMLKDHDTPWLDPAVEEAYANLTSDTRLFNKPQFWKRWVMIPAPVVVVAAAGICILFTALFITTGLRGGNPVVMKQQGPLQLEMNELQLQDLHQFFDSQDYMIEAQMDIPSNGGFTFIGEPQFLRVENGKNRQQ